MAKRLTDNALIEHFGKSHISRVHLESVNTKLMEAQDAARQKEIIAWLSPSAYDVDFYKADLTAVRNLRHRVTCTWILGKDGFARFKTGFSVQESLIWIYARPGAGKTILSSFLIDHFQSYAGEAVPISTMYFFCKSTDSDKNTSTSILKSLLYQLYIVVQDPNEQRSLSDDIGIALERSGQQKATNFDTLWTLFSSHITQSNPPIIILDALDECIDPQPLIRAFKSISGANQVKILVTSREEAHLRAEFRNILNFEITLEDISADIAAYVKAKVLASPRLSNHPAGDIVIKRLCRCHDGMFLWVYLVLKELKGCISVAQVNKAISDLPRGLDDVYGVILRRLNKTLSIASADLCKKIFMWIIYATVRIS